MPVFALDDPADAAAEVKQASSDRLWVIRPLGKKAQPALKPGQGHAHHHRRPAGALRLREAVNTVTRDLEVRLDPPRVGVVSLHHFLNLGGAEFVVLRATPPDVNAGVRVGELSFPAFPGQPRRPHRSGAAGGVLRPALRPGRRRPGHRLRPRRGRQRSDGARWTASRSPSAFSARGSRSTDASSTASCRPSPRTRRRSAHRRHRRRPAAGVPDHQPRPAPAEQPDDRGAGGQDRARDAVAGGVLAARQHPGRVALRRLPHLLLQGQGDRPADAPRLRPRLDPAGAGDRRRTAASSSTPTISASTATASSSITAWACSRSTRTCRRWT